MSITPSYLHISILVARKAKYLQYSFEDIFISSRVYHCPRYAIISTAVSPPKFLIKICETGALAEVRLKTSWNSWLLYNITKLLKPYPVEHPAPKFRPNGALTEKSTRCFRINCGWWVQGGPAQSHLNFIPAPPTRRHEDEIMITSYRKVRRQSTLDEGEGFPGLWDVAGVSRPVCPMSCETGKFDYRWTNRSRERDICQKTMGD